MDDESLALASIDLPYIERNKSRHGRYRYYFRYEGQRLARLPDNPEEEAFSLEYWKIRRRVEVGEAMPPMSATTTLPRHPKPNTFHWLAFRYLASDAFRQLDGTTRAKRRAIIDSMLLEPVKPASADIFADMPLRALTVENIQVLRDRKALTPFAADERLKILRRMLDTTEPGREGLPTPIMRTNFARLVTPFRKKTDGFHTITADEVAQYIKHHGERSKAVLAIVLLMFTGMRVSDLQAVGPQHRRGDTLHFRVFKGRNRNPVVLDIPIHPILATVLAWHPVSGMAYMLTEHGKRYSIKGLSQRVSAWFDQAGLPHCSAHTVRKGLATLLAENEATDSMLDGLFGWKDGKTSKIYTARKQQAKLARQAVSRIEWEKVWQIDIKDAG